MLHAVCRQAEIGPRATVGPFAYLRPGASMAEDAHIGTYVELKKAVIGAGAKVPHLTYVGDATIGAGANIGAGTIFANYDGVAKHHTDGRRARVRRQQHRAGGAGDGRRRRLHRGRLGDHRGRAAGELGIARGRQHNSEGWVARNRQGTRSADAASTGPFGRIRRI